MPKLYRIREAPDLYVDACLRHPQTGELLFLSVYGRDGSILAFFAAFALPKAQGGLAEFGLDDEDGATSSVYVNAPDRLTKHTGKLPRNLFGNLVQAWIYDPTIIRPDRANRTAWGLYRDGEGPGSDSEGAPSSAAWQTIQDLSPVPLAPSWREWVMAMTVEKRHLVWLDEPGTLHPPLGPIKACRVDLSSGFVEAVSEAVRAGTLTVPEAAQGTPSGEPAVVSTAPAPQPRAQVSLGRVVGTPGVDDKVPHDRVMACLQRHQAGDWGCVPSSDRLKNDRALRTGEDRILSAFEIDPEVPASSSNTFWVITERVDQDSRVTTVLLPSEY